MNLGLWLGFNFDQGILFEDQAWLISQASDITLDGLRRTVYRKSLENNIKSVVGVPSNQPTGLQDGVTCGASGSLAAGSNGNNVASSATAASLSDSGSGTEEDPYAVEGKEFDGAGSAAEAYRFSDGSATYYFKFVNCRFFDHTAQNVYVTSTHTGNVEFENCTFYNTVNNAECVRNDGGTITYTNCLLSGCLSTPFWSSNGTSADIVVRNLQVNTANGDYSNNSDIFWLAGAGTLDARYVDCDVTGSANQVRSLFGIWKPDSTLQNFVAKGVKHGIVDGAANLEAPKSITARYFDIQDPVNEAILMYDCDDGLFEYFEADHTTNGSGSRLVYFTKNDVNNNTISNITVQYADLDKQTGTNAPTNEVLQFDVPVNCISKYIYIRNAPEDAIEYTLMPENSGNEIGYCVIENCANECVNPFRMYNEAGTTLITDTSAVDDVGMYVHHIFGDCDDYVLHIEGLAGLVFHDIYANNTGGDNVETVRIADKDGAVVRNVYGAGPLPLQSERGDGTTTNAVSISGGANIEVRYFDNENGTGSITTVTS